jgi:DNA-binding winged helix-turn-helix (wHTH) protein
LDWLRSLATRYGGALVFVIGSTEPLAVLTSRVGGTAVSPLANLFHNIHLGLLNEGETAELCQAAAVAEGVAFTADEVAFLRQEAGGHPDLLKVACEHLLAAKRSGQRGVSLLETVAAAVRLDGHVQWLCQQLLARRAAAEREMLLNLADGRALADPILLTQLRQLGLVTDSALFADAFRYWLRREPAVEPEREVQAAAINHKPEKKLVTIDEREVRLTPLENRLLAYFLGRANEVCTVEELLTDIWGAGKTRSVVEKGVSRLREKIEADPKRPRYLLSAWGEGYLLRTAVAGQEKL